MPTPDFDLLAKWSSHALRHFDVAQGWELLKQGVEIGWIDRHELRELCDELSGGRDWVSERLLFENRDDLLWISFARDAIVCSREHFLEEVRALLLTT